MSEKFITVYCSPGLRIESDITITSKLRWNGFKKSTNKSNLYYRHLPVGLLNHPSVGVSYYYYVNGLRKQYINKDFASFIKSTVDRLEREEYTRAFNTSNGYDSLYA